MSHKKGKTEKLPHQDFFFAIIGDEAPNTRKQAYFTLNGSDEEILNWRFKNGVPAGTHVLLRVDLPPHIGSSYRVMRDVLQSMMQGQKDDRNLLNMIQDALATKLWELVYKLGYDAGYKAGRDETATAMLDQSNKNYYQSQQPRN